MKLFKKNNRNTSQVNDKAAGWIANGILKSQNNICRHIG